MMKLRVAFWMVLASLAVAPSALAQVPQFELERLQLDPTAKGSLVLGDGEVGPQWSTRFFLAGHLEHQPLVLKDDGTYRGRGMGAKGNSVDVVKDRVTAHLGIAVAVLDSLELYLRLPYVADQKSDLVAGAPKKNGIGGPSFGFRWGIAGQGDQTPVSIAFAADLYPGWGTRDAFAGNPDFSWAVAPRIEVGHRFEKWLIALQGNAVFRESAIKLSNSETLDAEFGGGLVVATTGKLRGELSVRGTVNQNDIGRHAEALAGLRYSIGEFELFALGGPGFGDAVGTPQWRALAGIALNHTFKKPPPPPPPDPCAAGKVHTPDQCPNLDDDGDGVANKDDACPTVPGLPELKGCPAKDTDGDGIADHLDKCPTVAGIAELQGCPAVDTDGDGIPDHKDKCPTVAGIAELQGCPAVDTDGDGVPDHLDKCPTVKGEAAYQGCPAPKAELKQGKIDIKEAVYFDTAKATIQSRSNALLDEVAQILKDNPQVTKVVVEGHTDSQGKAASNRKLSQARADAVKAYLVGKGVDAARLDAKGFGPDKPVASNKTKDGREKNRRVEFTISGVAK
jgi:outer membrane protein OmpA-like peptidoglycan-associated protein